VAFVDARWIRNGGSCEEWMLIPFVLTPELGRLGATEMIQAHVQAITHLI
jgi:hypothetical protein